MQLLTGKNEISFASKTNLKPKTVNTEPQNLHNQEAIDKLRLENVELKKSLEREQLLHSMLYKEWKELSDRASANEYPESKPGNPFYKYAFFLLLISIFPAYYLLNANKGNEKKSPPQAASVPVINRDSTLIKDSLPQTNSTVTASEIQDTKQDTVKQEIPAPPVVNIPEKKIIAPDSSATKEATIYKPIVEPALTDSDRDVIYWNGWNAYYSGAKNHFRKSSNRYKVWLEGYNDGRNDAKNKPAKDSIQK